MSDDLEIRKVLVLSTSHAKQETMDVAELNLNFTGKFEYGAYFYVGDLGTVDALNDPEDYPTDLYECLMFAKEHGCDEVKFDCDGPILEGLPTYDW